MNDFVKCYTHKQSCPDKNIVKVTSIANFVICSTMCKKHTAVAVVLTDLCYFQGISRYTCTLNFCQFSSWKND